jgi:hypothetical protein
VAGKAKAVDGGADLVEQVKRLALDLHLEAKEQFRVARRLWGAERKIDVVLRNPANGKTLGVECKYQAVGGTAEEKIPTTIQDIAAWPIDGIVVFAGPGFTTNMKSYLLSTGKAVEFADLEAWLRLYFGLPLA